MANKRVRVWQVIPAYQGFGDWVLAQCSVMMDRSELEKASDNNPVDGRIQYQRQYLYQCDVEGYGDLTYFNGDS
jgi:hypothetical protein